LPASLSSIATAPDVGIQADRLLLPSPLVDVGQAATAITNDLTGMAALIQRSTVNFSDSIARAAQAGAVFAVIYNNAAGSSGCPGGDALCPMAATDFVPIPAVFIGQTDGENLRGFIAPIVPPAPRHSDRHELYFNVTNTLVCEHVGVRLQTDYPLRANLRITLVSPMGTRSILQTYNNDINAGPVDWTYYSTHHFFESSAGAWTLTVSDQGGGASGSILGGQPHR